MDYELVKVDNNYNLIELTRGEIFDGNVEDKTKVIASTLYVRDSKNHKLHIDSCRELFGGKEVRKVEVSMKYKSALYGTKEELQGVLEMLRLQTYNYLSGRTNLLEYIKLYDGLENFLWEHGIIELNSESLDEDNDDEYFNDFLEAEHLQRVFTKDDLDKVYDWNCGTYGKQYKTYDDLVKSLLNPTRVRVTLSSTKPDEGGYIEMFRYDE